MGKFDNFCQSCGMPLDQDQTNTAAYVMKMGLLWTISKPRMKWSALYVEN